MSREQEVEEVKKVRGKEERFVKEFLWKCCESGVIIEEEFNKRRFVVFMSFCSGRLFVWVFEYYRSFLWVIE